jgi:type VI secretion system secreted protein VgrG
MGDLTTTRDFWVTTPLGDGVLALERMEGHESLGQPFSYELTLMSSDPNIDLSKLLGLPMTVHCQMIAAGETRHFNGIVTRASHLDADGRHSRYTATLHPWLSLLDLRFDCRIFQQSSIPDIIKDVFRKANCSDFEDTLDADAYPQLEYCVQYNESDFNFVSRLMEHAGIYYYFKHTEDKHVLVLADAYGAHEPREGYEKIEFDPERDDESEAESLSSWVAMQQIRPGAFATIDFDFAKPRSSLLSALSKPQSYANAEAEVYVYPGDFLTKADGDRRVKRRLEERQHEHAMIQASGDVRGPGSGNLFALIDHPRKDQNKEYLVVGALYSIHAGDFESGDQGGDEQFHVSYTLLDSAVAYRTPLRASKFRIEGPQTAMVVGPSGEEIWTDKYGRVMLQFHWDREGMSDERSSCWVRVAQVWAGSGWGAMHIPRIGQEVIVDFLEGDPDRPIIVGRVYNGDNMPPYGLPDNKTQSGIKSRSTPGGGPSNFNEIRFEDKKGKEELHVQAEKDHSTLVKHNQSISVGADRSVSVGGNESISVSGSRTTTVTKKETETFSDVREMTVTKTETLTVNGKHTGTYGNDHDVSITGKDTLTVGKDKIDTITGKYDIDASKEFQVTQGANSLLIKNAVTVDSEGDVVLQNPGCQITAGKTGSLKMTAMQEIQLQCGAASITLKMDGSIVLDGVTGIQATAGPSTLKLAPDGSSMQGPKVGLTGMALVEVAAPIVKVG